MFGRKQENPLERCTFAGCGELVRRSAMASHWIIAGHAQNPNVRAVRVDVLVSADNRKAGR